MGFRDKVKPRKSVEVAVIGGLISEYVKSGDPRIVYEKQVDTSFGRSGPIALVKLDEYNTIAFLGRYGRNAWERSPPFINYLANIYALKDLGISRIISVNGVGAINKRLSVGQLLVPHDFIDFTSQRPLTFFTRRAIGFVRMNPAFCPELRTLLIQLFRFCGFSVYSRSVYVCMDGPRYETPAEVRMLRKLGADIVGMTVATEAILARQLAMCYASICFVQNLAEGLISSTKPGIEGMVPRQQRHKIRHARSAIREVISIIPKRITPKRHCLCIHALDQDKKEEALPTDWHQWF